jgi:hypothetical protein
VFISFVFFLPVVVSIVLGPIYLATSAGSPWVKLAGVVAFGAAVYLQFFSAYPLAGLLVQVGVALSLAVWRKLRTP